MSKINANTEWGTLKEVILGNAEWAQVPRIKNKDIHCVENNRFPVFQKR